MFFEEKFHVILIFALLQLEYFSSDFFQDFYSLSLIYCSLKMISLAVIFFILSYLVFYYTLHI